MSEEKTIEDYLEKHEGYAHPMPLKTIQQIAEDLVNHPPHYTAHPSGVECIQITETMNFCLGNAIKYIWRADLKHDAIEDLKKAVWYVNREIERRTKALQAPTSTKVSSRKS
jgi:hypothetical protein